MREQQFVEKVQANIARIGWSVVAVAGDEEFVVPSWAYTIGLAQTLRHPELVIVGLPPTTAHQILNTVGTLVREGTQLVPGMQSNAVLQGYPVVFRNVHTSWYSALFGSAHRVYGNWAFAMFQVYYPDSAGLFPWDAACMAGIRERQSRLDVPPTVLPAPAA